MPFAASSGPRVWEYLTCVELLGFSALSVTDRLRPLSSRLERWLVGLAIVAQMDRVCGLTSNGE